MQAHGTHIGTPVVRRVEDVYRQGIRTIAADAPMDEVARHMQDDDIGALLVVEGDRITGIITERDLVRATCDCPDLRTCIAADYVTSDPATVGLDTDLHHVAAQMVEFQVRHLPVVEGGEVVGMISARDVLELAAIEDDGGT
jgi:CBS domain-containing protein